MGVSDDEIAVGEDPLDVAAQLWKFFPEDGEERLGASGPSAIFGLRWIYRLPMNFDAASKSLLLMPAS
jgi:hypothetical protein